MKIIRFTLIFFFCSVAFSAESKNSLIEMTIMSVGSLDGGKLKAKNTGCAVIHFMKRTDKEIYFPTGPRSLGKGRVPNWNGASYISPKQGKEYGWGYRPAYDIPIVVIEFVNKDGTVALRDGSIMMQNIGVMENAWSFTPILFSTPIIPGNYTLRLIFDNSIFKKLSGHNAIYGSETRPELVTLSQTIELNNIIVESKN